MQPEHPHARFATQVRVRLPAELAAWLTARAERERTSASELVRRLLRAERDAHTARGEQP